MKFTILINQYAAVKSGLKLDLIDLCIFDFVKDFANTANCIKMQTPEGSYFWISHKLVISSMPLLNIKTSQGIIKRIDNLIEAGLLIKHPNCEIYSKSLYQFGKNYDLLTFSPNSETLIQELHPINESLTGDKQEFKAPLNESLGNNTINDNNNNLLNSLFSEENNDKKTLFSNSLIFKLVENNDYTKFEILFEKELQHIDLVYYFHAVCDWSDSKNTKRTKKGWMATIRQFIRSDMQNNKLHKKTNISKVELDSATDFLKM